MTRYNTHTLPNGLRIIHLPSASQVVYCGYQLAVGSRHEQEDEEGLAHFCEHMTFKGTARRNALQIINSLEQLGGDLNAFTNKEDTTFYAAVEKEHMARAVDLLTDIVFCSRYPQHEIDKEVEVVCDEIESYNDSPAELIYDEFENLIFEGHPLGHNILGTTKLLHAYKTDDLLRFARRHYRPERAVFFAYGDVDFGRLVHLVERGFTAYGLQITDNYSVSSEGHANTPPANCKPSDRPKDACKARTVNQNIGSHQAHVMVGTRAYAYDDPRRMTLYLLNNMLGGPAMNARLNLSLRERHGLVYTVESTMASYGDMGCWSIYFGCDHSDVKRCLRLIRRETDKLMSRRLTDRQLSAAKRQLKGQLAIACDNREQFALDFGRIYLHHGQERDLDTLFQRIDAVSADDIISVANELFSPEQLTTLTFT